MKAYIDFSVFTQSSSLGRIHGSFDFYEIPKVGETLELEVSTNNTNRFSIESVCEVDSGYRKELLVSLENLVVEEHDEFVKVGEYLEKKHGLYLDDSGNRNS